MEITYDDALELADMAGGELYANYSGRGMYGSKCLGITSDYSLGPVIGVTLVELFTNYDRSNFDEAVTKARRIANSASSDSMGMGTITYFPGVEVTGAPEDDYDDDEDYE